MRTFCALIALTSLSLGLAACGKADNEPGPGGVTGGEAKALDEAAEMLEKQRLPAEALRPTTPTPASASAPTPASTAGATP